MEASETAAARVTDASRGSASFNQPIIWTPLAYLKGAMRPPKTAARQLLPRTLEHPLGTQAKRQLVTQDSASSAGGCDMTCSFPGRSLASFGQRRWAVWFIACWLSACSSPQYRALNGWAEAPIEPPPRYDALGARALLTPSVEQWALYEEVSAHGRALLTAVLSSKSAQGDWLVELTRRSRRRATHTVTSVLKGDDPFLRLRLDESAQSIAAVQVPAGVFIGALRQGESIFHPRVPVNGLVTGQDAEGRRWRLLRFGLGRPPALR